VLAGKDGCIALASSTLLRRMCIQAAHLSFATCARSCARHVCWSKDFSVPRHMVRGVLIGLLNMRTPPPHSMTLECATQAPCPGS